LELNIFTCCNDKYTNFVPIFIFSHLFHNNDSFVEVCWDIPADENIYLSLDYLEKQYPGRFLVRSSLIDKLIHNGKIIKCNGGTNRFILVPFVKTKYIYISDIDIICLQYNIKQTHIDNMNSNNLPYSNVVRKNSEPKRLTGLHFTPYDNYYPLPAIDDLLYALPYDEVFLYEVVKKKFPNFNYDSTFRPVHGIHASLHRNPLDDIGWGITKSRKKQWGIFRETQEFKNFENNATPFTLDLIKKIDAVVYEK